MTKTRAQPPGCLGFLRNLLGGNKQKVTIDSYPYRIRDDFLSPAELSFYHLLTSLVGAKATVAVKVRLADLFFVMRPHESLAAFNRIAQRHIDFVFCHPATMKPLFAVELDDSSHQRADRKSRDKFVDQAFQSAGLPLLHIQTQMTYNLREIAVQIMPFLDGTPEACSPNVKPEVPSAGEAKQDMSSIPLCPKCGVPMVLRTATRSVRQGQQFYGCQNYPKCREIRRLQQQ
jgi:predicted RNA-binding Zn-ribbon protein involved in translation (DUF1610 family)